MKIRRSLGAIGATSALAVGTLLGLSPAANAAPAAESGTAAATSQSASGRTITDTADARTLKATGGNAVAGTSAADAPYRADANCWNGSTSGRNFYMTCSGNGYRVYVDCSNGVRYIFSTYYYGSWNHTLTCPSGTSAIWGGSIGG
ncbi:hypothetical protein [Streptomyces albus]|uniref:hypothetical protein n=1 Tax=Streptomyces albus TaxID=1888 RepID=UPI0004CC3FE5|nr:hypothetical protein [Streptomyces albus]